MPEYLGSGARMLKRNNVIAHSTSLHGDYKLQAREETLLINDKSFKIAEVGVIMNNLEAGGGNTYCKVVDVHNYEQVSRTIIHPSILGPVGDCKPPIVACNQGRGDSNAHMHV